MTAQTNPAAEPQLPPTLKPKGTTMANKYVPDDLTLTEAACVNWTLARIKTAILSEGMPSGKAIDQALEELFHVATARTNP